MMSIELSSDLGISSLLNDVKTGVEDVNTIRHRTRNIFLCTNLLSALAYHSAFFHSD